jgi:L-asparagine oxygenase
MSVQHQPAIKHNIRRRTRLILRRSAGGAGTVAEILVSAASARRLRTQIDLFRSLPPYDSAPASYEAACATAIGVAAPSLARALRALRRLEAPPAMFVIRGLQVSETEIATPLDGVVNQAAAAVELAIFVGVMRHLGFSGVAYARENGGRLFRGVCPVLAYSLVANSQGAKADLNSHTDNGHFPIPASDDEHPFRYPEVNRVQLFVTLKSEPGVPMRIRLLDDVLSRLDARAGDPGHLPEYADLHRSEFRYVSPPSHGFSHVIAPLPALVTLTEPAGAKGLRFHADTMEGTTPRAVAALELLAHAVLTTPEETITTEQGDIIGYDNRRVTHRREPYDARFDGTDRYYVRLYGQASDEVRRWEGALGGNGRVM